MPSEFAYIDSELDSILIPALYSNLEPAARSARHAEVRRLLESYDRVAREAARKMLAELEGGSPAD